MLNYLLEHPILILILIVILIFAIGIITASTAFPRFKKILAKYQETPHSLNMASYQIISWGIKKLQQKNTKLFLIDGEKQDDCYIPAKDAICLSKKVYYGTSISDLAIASHEFGHSIQKNNHSIGTKLCYFFSLINNFLQNLVAPLMFIGFIVYIIPFEYNIIGLVMIWTGAIGFLINILLKILLIPHEYNASTRALKFLKENTPLSKKEIAKVKEVLRAAGDTYVASLFYRPYLILNYIFKSR